MQKVCPIAPKMVPAVVPRLVATFVIILSGIFIMVPNPWIPLFLTFDFFMRGVIHKYTPLGCGSSELAKLFKKTEPKINAGPKWFAAKLGLIMVALILISFLLGHVLVAQVLAGVLIILASLEAVFAFCLGCLIYPYWLKVAHVKCSKKYAPYLQATIMGVTIALWMTFVVTSINLGWQTGFIEHWLKAWVIATVVVIPTILVVKPVVEKMVKYLTRD